MGGDYKNTRHSKRETLEQTKGKCLGKKNVVCGTISIENRFYCQKVGSTWDDVFSEAKSRLDQAEPIFHMVALKEADKEDFVRTGESAYFWLVC